MSLSDKPLAAWRERFVGDPAVRSQAPGRVNLIGEHTDYNRGLVMPAAIDRRVTVLAREAAADRVESAQIRNPDNPERTRRWQRYFHACRAALESRSHPAPPVEMLIWSNVPSGSGLSSSAALQVAILGAWNALVSLGLSPRELANLAWIAETEHVGVQVGKMDQWACSMGVAGHALYIDMDTEQILPTPLPDDVVLAILDTRKPRSLAAGKYNERVSECLRAVVAVSAFKPVSSLRQVEREDLERAKREGLDDLAYRRARHVLTENRRVEECREALLAGDLKSIGALCEESHRSLKEDYEVTTPELDAMARSARSAPGCIGARMTGAGFGGCCVALVGAGAYRPFSAATAASYGMYGFPSPHIFSTTASDGASAVTL